MMTKECICAGTILEVYEDLGPSLRVKIQHDAGHIYDIDADSLPFSTKELRENIGKGIRVETVATIS